jgi:hypothetical protein
MIVRTFLLALCLLLCSVPPALAKSGGANRDNPWNAEHIVTLPVEVRQYIASICKGPPRAQHEFATYSPHERRWRINLEYLQCVGRPADYRLGNQCMDVDFVAEDAHFRLVSKHYADCGF